MRSNSLHFHYSLCATRFCVMSCVSFLFTCSCQVHSARSRSSSARGKQPANAGASVQNVQFFWLLCYCVSRAFFSAFHTRLFACMEPSALCSFPFCCAVLSNTFWLLSITTWHSTAQNANSRTVLVDAVSVSSRAFIDACVSSAFCR